MSLHEWSEQSKRLFDFASALSAVAAITLSQVALVISCIAGVLSITWYAIRIHDRIRNGPSGD